MSNKTNLSRIILAGALAFTMVLPTAAVYAENDEKPLVVEEKKNAEEQKVVIEIKEKEVKIDPAEAEKTIKDNLSKIEERSSKVDKDIKSVQEKLDKLAEGQEGIVKDFTKFKEEKEAFNANIKTIEESLKAEEVNYASILKMVDELKERLYVFEGKVKELSESADKLIPSDRFVDSRFDKVQEKIKNLYYELEDLKVKPEERQKKVNEFLEETKKIKDSIEDTRKIILNKEKDNNEKLKEVIKLEDSISKIDTEFHEYMHKNRIEDLEFGMEYDIRYIEGAIYRFTELKLNSPSRIKERDEYIRIGREAADKLRKAKKALARETLSLDEIQKIADECAEVAKKIEEAEDMFKDQFLELRDKLETYLTNLNRLSDRLVNLNPNGEIADDYLSLTASVSYAQEETKAILKILDEKVPDKEEINERHTKLVEVLKGIEDSANKVLKVKRPVKPVPPAKEEVKTEEKKNVEVKAEVKENSNPKYKKIQTSDPTVVASSIFGQLSLLGSALAAAGYGLKKKNK